MKQRSIFLNLEKKALWFAKATIPPKAYAAIAVIVPPVVFLAATAVIPAASIKKLNIIPAAPPAVSDLVIASPKLAAHDWKPIMTDSRIEKIPTISLIVSALFLYLCDIF